MKIKHLLLPLALWLSIGCIKEPKARIPAYLEIPGVNFHTDWNTQGSNSHNINTVWAFSENELIGVYDLPARIILPFEGKRKLRVVFGISENGIQLQRSQYPFLEEYSEDFVLIPGETYYFNQDTDSIPSTRYRDNVNVIIVEDFNGIGLNLDRSDRSDTSMRRINDPEHLFVNPLREEDNNFSGVAYLPEGRSLVEFISNREYNLPKFNNPVFAELNFKGNIPFDVGIFAQTATQIIQSSVVKVNPRAEWRKIYINLTQEVSGNFDAFDYKLFVGAVKGGDTSPPAEFYLDHVKIVHFK